MDGLPEECIVRILSCGSAGSACRSAMVCSMFRDAADSEVLWDKLLPPDHHQIVSTTLSPLTFKSKKELYCKLLTPLLIDGGLKTMWIDKASGKKCYMLSARDLYIAWSTNSLFWCWKPLLKSRFAEVVELRMTSWLEVEGKINNRMLSPNTHYGAYLVAEVAGHRAFGLDKLPFEVSIEHGEFKSQGKIILSRNDDDTSFERIKEGRRSKSGEENCRVSDKRKDGWLEIALGEFYNHGTCEREVKISFKDVNGVHLKGGLVIEGLEIRPCNPQK